MDAWFCCRHPSTTELSRETVGIAFVGLVAAEQPLLIGERSDNYDLGALPLARAEGVTDEVLTHTREFE